MRNEMKFSGCHTHITLVEYLYNPHFRVLAEMKHEKLHVLLFSHFIPVQYLLFFFLLIVFFTINFVT